MRPTKTSKTVTQADLIWMRSNEDKTLNPLPITFKLIDPLITEKIIVLKEKLSGITETEDKTVIQNAINQLEQLIDDADVFKGYFKPIKIGEWGVYQRDNEDKETVVRKHLCNKNGSPLFDKDNEIKFSFLAPAFNALIESSDISGVDRKKASQILDDATILLQRNSVLRELKSESKEQKPLVESSIVSSSTMQDSNLGRSAN